MLKRYIAAGEIVLVALAALAISAFNCGERERAKKALTDPVEFSESRKTAQNAKSLYRDDLDDVLFRAGLRKEEADRIYAASDHAKALANKLKGDDKSLKEIIEHYRGDFSKDTENIAMHAISCLSPKSDDYLKSLFEDVDRDYGKFKFIDPRKNVLTVIIKTVSDVGYLISVIEKEDREMEITDYRHTPEILKWRGRDIYLINPVLVDRIAEGCPDPVSRKYALKATSNIPLLERCAGIDCDSDNYRQRLKEAAQERLEELGK